MGGIALGKAVVSSGLLEQFDVVIRSMVSGLPLYSVVLSLSCVVMVTIFFTDIYACRLIIIACIHTDRWSRPLLATLLQASYLFLLLMKLVTTFQFLTPG